MRTFQIVAVALLAVVTVSCTGASDPTTTTTAATTTAPSTYAAPDADEVEVWASDALSYLRSVGYRVSSSRAYLDDLRVDARGWCGDLVSGRDPALIEADVRRDLGMEQWEAFGAVWWDSVLNDLCLNRNE